MASVTKLNKINMIFPLSLSPRPMITAPDILELRLSWPKSHYQPISTATTFSIPAGLAVLVIAEGSALCEWAPASGLRQNQAVP